MSTPPAVWTIGHGARREEELIALLGAHAIACVADVRRFPRSRRHPHFDRERLAVSLPAAGVRYVHLEPLGGMREPDGSTLNRGLPDGAFRGYADYMQTPSFDAALAALLALAAERRTAIMCAEADPAHCHRSLVADALLARGVRVLHVTGPGAAAPHALARGARVAGARVRYPAAQTELGLE